MDEKGERSATVAAEFDSPERVIEAATRVRALGFAKVEAYTPFPLVELDEALALRRPPIPRLVLAAGALGVTIALGTMAWTNGIDYPLDVGGRPLLSWPTYVPIAFETMVLFAALTAFGSVLLLSRLPRLHDAVFDLPGFERSTVDRFWLTIGDLDEARLAALHAALDDAGAIAVHGPGARP